jgi:hypothetical protein
VVFSKPTASELARWCAIGALVFVGSVWFFARGIGVWSIPAAMAWAALAATVIEAAARRASWRWVTPLLVVWGVAAVAAFAAIYPRLDVHDPGHGSDRDDDADIAVLAAAHGGYPYRPRTYLDNAITHLPGSLVVAAPFVAVGGSALENVAVLPLAAWLLARKTRSAEATVLVVGIAAASLGVWHEFLTGGNSLAEWAIISVAAVWFAQSARQGWTTAALAFALNTRTNAWSAAGAAVGSAGRRSVARALRVGALIAAVQFALVAPFLIGGLHRFTPVTGGSGKFAHLDALFPHASTAVPVIAALAGTVAAITVARLAVLNITAATLAGIAASQLVQFGVLIACSLAAGHPEWARNWSSYLTLAVLPGACAIAFANLRSAA